jgi:large subunit ribosomal protein L32e
MPASYRRPKFNREESWRYLRVKTAWRSPKGKTSRVRRSKKGWPAVVKIGYSRPKATRGKHPSGLTEILVWRTSDLEKIDEKTQVARIAHTVGENKRVQIVEEAKKRNIRILNPGLKKAPEAEVAPEPEPTPEAAPAEAKPESKEETAEPSKTPSTKKTTKKPKSGKSAK